MAWESSDERNRGQQAPAIGTAASLRGVWKRSLVAALLLGCATGCQALREKSDSLKNSSRDILSWQRKEGEKTADDPSRMVVIWSESVIYGPGKKPTRGLGGRVYFYNRTHQPVKAEGEMTVFAYADQEATGKDSDEGAVNADRKYVFTAEEFKNHYSATEFGPSYSIWVPWDAVGGEQQAISLVPVFKTTAGEAIMGDHSRTLLAGKNPKKDAALARRRLREGAGEDIRHGFRDDVAHTKYERATDDREDAKDSRAARRQRDAAEDNDLTDVTTEAGFANYEDSRQDDRSTLRRAMREEEAIDESSETQGERRPAIRTMTIPVPSTMRQRLLEAGEEEAASATRHADAAENAEEEFDEEEDEVTSPRKRPNSRREARRIPSPRKSTAMNEDVEERSWDEEEHEDADQDPTENGPSRRTRASRDASRTTRPQAPLIRREPSPLRAQASRAAQPTADRPRSLPGLAALPLPAHPELPSADSPSEGEASDPSVLVSSSSPWSARSVRKQNRPVVVYEPGPVAD